MSEFTVFDGYIWKPDFNCSKSAHFLKAFKQTLAYQKKISIKIQDS